MANSRLSVKGFLKPLKRKKYSVVKLLNMNLILLRAVAYLIVLATVWALVVKVPINYAYSDFKDYVASLISISGIVFTIMGIWIAFLYPNALSRIISDKVQPADFTDTAEDTKRLENIVAAILKSAVVATVLAAASLLKIFLWGTPIYLTYHIEIKGLALAVISLLSIVQLEAVVSVIAANVLFLTDLHNKREKRQQDQSF